MSLSEEANRSFDDQERKVRREEFAAYALMGILSNPTWNDAQLRMLGIDPAEAARFAAIQARNYADKLLLELEAQPVPKKPTLASNVKG
jgi:hypothetical protein